jgi:hypothetical protein
MRTRTGLALAFVVSAMALTGACTEQENQERPASANATPTPSWEGKEDQEDAMRRATRALNAVESDGASRVDAGMENLAQGLDKTLEAKGGRPYTFGIACQAPTHRTVTLRLARGDADSEWEVTCGDREADRFDIPAGGRFTARIAPAGEDTDGLVLWRLDTVSPDDVDGCGDDIEGCER